MIRTMAFAALLAGHSAALAQDGRLPRADDVIRSPDSFKGREVWIEAAGCVDAGQPGFLCSKRTGGQLLVVRGLALGPMTAPEIAETLISRCKGTANIDSRACRMNVLLRVEAVEREMIDTDRGSIQRTVLETTMVEFSRPAR